MSLAVDNPIQNNPFDEPSRYWDYKEGQPATIIWISQSLVSG
jgi:hypothetical protein